MRVERANGVSTGAATGHRAEQSREQNVCKFIKLRKKFYELNWYNFHIIFSFFFSFREKRNQMERRYDDDDDDA